MCPTQPRLTCLAWLSDFHESHGKALPAPSSNRGHLGAVDAELQLEGSCSSLLSRGGARAVPLEPCNLGLEAALDRLPIQLCCLALHMVVVLSAGARTCFCTGVSAASA